MFNSLFCEGKRITVIGAGVSGLSLAVFASSLGAQVFISADSPVADTSIPEKLKALNIPWEEGHTARAYESECMLLSSGIPPSSPAVKGARRRGMRVMGELDFLSPHLSGKILGITGSNGKSTTTSLLGHMLKKRGFRAAVAGNIGIPLAEAAGKTWDYIVVELSSFQLFWNTSLACDLSIVTNLAPDHIDWHGSYGEYIQAKKRILTTRKKNSPAILQLRDRAALQAEDFSESGITPFYWKEEGNPSVFPSIVADEDRKAAFLRHDGDEDLLFSFPDLPLLGNHNIENAAMAAGALRLLGVRGDLGALFEGFRGLEHRCEFVAKKGGRIYIDDSKGTNVASSSTALTSIQGTKVVILGGKGKGENYAPLAETVKKEALAAVVLGEEREKITAALVHVGFEAIFQAADMEDAVRQASQYPDAEVVLLSPACTSWDMYPNYQKRGEHFRAIVCQLKEDDVG
ncbi:MAG: UDP-N-acetylmuramoyl-L-alanine--D-glutamate ligase [Synergistaceae bacterium]|nr:UDP-N-acetylmuramoyl-L-alanine--D-glutamate ligase [Synergistaceae bacterium]